MATVKMVQNDTAPDLPFTVKRSGVAVNITGATVNFKIKDDQTGNRTNDAHNECILVTPSQGTCYYSFIAGDLPSAGSYTCDVQVTYATGKIETGFDAVIITARAEV